MTYDSFEVWWWPYLFIILAGVLPTAIWRWLGVILVGNLDETSEWLIFIRCLATALVAAVIAQFVFDPSGVVAELPMPYRFAALAVGFLAFLILNRRMIVGVAVTQIMLIVSYLLVVG